MSDRGTRLREIELMARRTSQHDYMFFYYTGHGDQVTCRHGSEPDRKDEAIITYTGRRIIDNVLKKCLVDPLPRGAKLFALWDCCHSHTMLDLEHYNCNSWRASLKVLSGWARKTKSFGKMLSAGLLRGGSGTRSSTKDDPQAKIASSTFDSMKICRVTSPDSYEAGCTPNCSMTLPEQRVKANVVSLSACRDNELAYDDNVTGETVTKFFIACFERNPEATYQDLLSYIRQNVDAITRRRIGARKSTGEISHYQHHLQTLSGNEVDTVDWDVCKHHDRNTDDNDTATLSSQHPSVRLIWSSRVYHDILFFVDSTQVTTAW
ncbi:hypothetical protein M405DRAFT_362332 [Rhizopogon salebrosus TDB-379]|nr:hypothetical protein M405DRAFT_362332 [Rhizopogon salebrosus TDB-379]